LLFGWATGTFGWFGLRAQSVNIPVLNYFGAGLSLVVLVLLVFIKQPDEEKANESEASKPQQLELETVSETDSSRSSRAWSKSEDVEEDLRRRTTRADLELSAASAGTIPPRKGPEIRELRPGDDGYDPMIILKRLSPVKKKVVGFACAIAAGLFGGQNFTPSTWVQNNVPDASTDGLDYIWSHTMGVLLMSTVFMVVYAVLMRNNPNVNTRLILPSLFSGFLWTLATAGSFLASASLGFVLVFPIINVLPATVATVAGVVLFGENRGTRNLVFLAAAGLTCTVSLICVTLSKALPPLA